HSANLHAGFACSSDDPGSILRPGKPLPERIHALTDQPHYCCCCGVLVEEGSCFGAPSGAGAPTTGAAGVNTGACSSGFFVCWEYLSFLPLVVCFFFFLPEVLLSMPSEADCICRFATSAAVGGVALNSVCAGFSLLLLLLSRARSLKRVLCSGACSSSGFTSSWLRDALSGRAPASSIAGSLLSSVEAEGSDSRGFCPKRIFSFLPGRSTVASSFLLRFGLFSAELPAAGAAAWAVFFSDVVLRNDRPVSRKRVRSTCALFLGAGGV